MHTTIETHIETDQQNAHGAELHRKIERLKAGISATMPRPGSDLTGLPDEQLATLPNIDLRKVIIDAGARILRHLQSTERREATLPFPPGAVAAVDDVSAWDEFP